MRALALAVLLGGCVGTQGPLPNGPIVPFLLDLNGIEAVGTGQRIDFGRAEAGVIQTMTRLQGAAPTTLACVNPGVTTVLWDDGVSLSFLDGSFAGWGSQDPAFSFDGRMFFGMVCIGPD